MLSNKKLITVCLVALSFNVGLIALFMRVYTPEKFFVTVSEHQSPNTVLPEDFLSFGIDASELEDPRRVDFRNERLRELTRALAPARLRVGGTASDRLIFSKDNDNPLTCEECHHMHSNVCSAIKKMCKHSHPFFIMTGSKWNDINDFCIGSDVKLLFTVNVLLRNENGWSDQNAKELIAYSKSKGYVLDWQLGNEPNSFNHTFNVTVHPQQLSNDFKKLRNILHENGFKQSLLVGPDTTRPQPHRPECLKYMVEFLGNASQYIDVQSWHQYYLNSRTAKLEDFWNPSTFELLKEQINTMKSHTEKYNSIPMWLTETSTSYGGGAPGLSNSFAGTPLWIDKLGLAAKNNITTVVRQSLYGGNYSLINHDLEPLPDWWASVLYKRLVGNRVLNIKYKCGIYQRMYAHCTNRKYTNDTSAITLYAVNLEMEKIKFIVNGTAIHGTDLDIDEYILRARSNYRETKTVSLNGLPLYYTSYPPTFKPKHKKYGTRISMPPYSVGFWVIKNTSIKACKHE